MIQIKQLNYIIVYVLIFFKATPSSDISVTYL